MAYSVAEAAEALGVSRDLVNSMIADGRLHSLKLGTRRLIPVSAMETLLGTHEGTQTWKQRS